MTPSQTFDHAKAAANGVRSSPLYPAARWIRGASTVEFLVVAPLLAAVGLGTMQTGLAYHGRTVLNYATFEAARTGATNHALKAPMLRELFTRLAPLEGGDGSGTDAASAVVQSLGNLERNVFTTVEILNPSRQAFEHFQVRSRESGKQVIPNSHLRSRRDQRSTLDEDSGVDLADANLLKIRVTHGFELKVPLMKSLVGGIMTRIDPVNARYYDQGLLPLTSVATVRMQSEVWIDDLEPVDAPPSGVDVPGESFAPTELVASANVPGQPQGSGDTEGETDPYAHCEGPLDFIRPSLPVEDPYVCAGPLPGSSESQSSSISIGSGQQGTSTSDGCV